MLYSGYPTTLQKHGKIQVYTTEDVLKTINIDILPSTPSTGSNLLFQLIYIF